MNNYELMVIIKPDIGSDAISKCLDDIRELIGSHKGEIYFEDLWGLRDMAYRMKKYDRGYYAVLDFKAESKGLKDMDTTLRLNVDVVRHMVVALPSSYEPKSYIVTEETEEQKAETEKKEEAKKETAKRPVRAPKAKVEAEEVKEEPKKKEVKESKKEEPTLEDVDAKLKSIIDNPDLNF